MSASTHSETRIVPYSADLMYRVVADVEQYPKFLPWVVALRVLSRMREGEREVVLAEMAVGYGALREKYTSRVVLDPVARSVDVAQTTGPFRQLENHWRFAPEGAGSRVDFSLAYEFKSRLLGAVAGVAFGKVYQQMADAFVARAHQLASAERH
ncbi:MAG: type II toxin-antitoxin system RatA family toxin [Alphaproteobacteria bacterium]|nr:type II toxin-antitoxin system RatA family toxin [Alphaproteobacteria bacterium]MBL6936414.1 type II toxin-antitoxin system RatA family toxin [Alphaproteobacteria bacterium]MBL7098535.1 type II toxin-antitoxin system RatA family toxin [Alphaproteobacteria bacterium]